MKLSDWLFAALIGFTSAWVFALGVVVIFSDLEPTEPARIHTRCVQANGVPADVRNAKGELLAIRCDGAKP